MRSVWNSSGGWLGPRERQVHLHALSGHAKVFDERDNACLTYLKDDGKPIEPEYYLPTLPMILVNGAEGIGTGFSCKVPPHNPMDVKENLKRFIRGESLKPMKPWFRGFKGSVTASDEGIWTLKGMWQASGDKVEVTELPPGTWTQTYKEFLEGLVEKNVIKNYSNHSTEEDVRFVITGYKGSCAGEGSQVDFDDPKHQHVSARAPTASRSSTRPWTSSGPTQGSEWHST
jgi:DNA topoisomerase-2